MLRTLKSRIRSLIECHAGPRLISVLAFAINPRPVDFSFRTVRSILILKLDEIGDFVLATPFLRELRLSAPQADITLVVKPSVYNLAEFCPHVNRVLVYDWQVEGRSLPQLRRHWRAMLLAFSELRKRHFDVALIPRWDADTYHATQLAVYAGSRAIVAYSERCTLPKSIHNRGFDRLVTHVLSPVRGSIHETLASLAILEKYGIKPASRALELWLTEEDYSLAKAKLPSGRIYVAIATGASKAYRRWPASRFAQLAVWLQEKYGFTPLLFGTHSDPALPAVVDFFGRSLRQTAALMARCTLFIGNDSGPKHIAAAVKIPVVEISALRVGAPATDPHSPRRFHAWDVPQRVVQPPPGVGEYGIDEVSFLTVQQAVDGLLNELESERMGLS